MYNRLLVIAVLITLASTVCDIQNQLSNIQSGSVTLESDSQVRSFVDQEYQYAFKNSFDSVPKAIYALQGFFSRSSRISEWHISQSQITRSKITIVFHHQSSQWNSITFGYWISSRPDIDLGNLIEGMDTSVTKTFSFSRTFSSKIPTVQNKTVVRTFLNGYVSETIGIVDFKFIHQITGPSQVNFLVQTQDMLLKKIYLSYIVFNSETANFKSYGGFLVQTQFMGSKVQSFQQNFHETPYSLHGIVSAKFNNSVNFRFNTKLDDQFFYRIDSSGMFQEFKILFIVIGVSPKQNCVNCVQKFISQGKCVQQCSNNEYQISYPDGAVGCRTCPRQFGYIIHPGRKGCTCQVGQVRGTNGFCVVVDPNQVTSTTTMITTTTTVSRQASNISSATSTINANNNNNLQSNNSASQLSNNNSQTTQNFSTQTSLINNSSNSNQPSDTTPLTDNLNSSFGSFQNSLNSNTFQIISSGFSSNLLENSQDTSAPQISSAFVPDIPVTVTMIDDCSSQPNTFFNGIQCACKVGYRKQNGFCSPVTFIGGPDIYVPPQFTHSLSNYHDRNGPVKCDNSNEIYNGQMCVCKAGYIRNQFGLCIDQFQCKSNQILRSGKCECKDGYFRANEDCISLNFCPQNSYYNGTQCVCQDDYRMFNNVCIKKCEKLNTHFVDGKCICLDGFYELNGNCLKCPEGQYHISGQCITLCGANQVTDSTGQCICKQGYGRFTNGICRICPTGSFTVNGYCVQCPIFSVYNEKNMRCQCKQGYILQSNGACKNTCGVNQVWDKNQNTCKCLNGYGRTNNQCQQCLGGQIDPATQICHKGCKQNEILHQGRCMCMPGLGYHKGACIQCQTISGSFLVDGYCAICPKGQTIGSNFVCQCPVGQKNQNGVCKTICKSNQLIDESGYCYECPIMQIIQDGKCVCRPGYQKMNGVCALSCQHFIIVGTYRCGFCPLNLVFDVELQACICPQGYYKNTKSICVPNQFVPIDCPSGFYFDSQLGCTPCPLGCSKCQNAQKCTVCALVGYIPRNGICVPQCGNNIISPGQQCDDGNKASNDGCSSTCQIETVVPFCGDGKISGTEQCDDMNNNSNDGCTNCRVDQGYTCNGAPSICDKQNQNKGIALKMKPLYNMANIFALITIDHVFNFSSDDEMRSLIKFNFLDPKTKPDSLYCLQQLDSPKDYRCLLVYNFGIPQKKFDVDFSYNRNGYSGYLRVHMNPLQSSFSTRSLV